ncbi:MAG: NAD(P)-dependent glycerol-3-phosphate dehydrogenase [Chloroflexi bacterium]|nr:NAD(P)-dependent glycerol-3-phosphate dehydrogenase [Chloroflexota bacterium]
MQEHVCIIGTGSWGTTLAIVFARAGQNVSLWARSRDESDALNTRRENLDFLPGIAFPLTVHVTHDLAEAVRGARICLAVVPSQTFRDNIRQARPYLGSDQIIVSAAKGIELGTLQRMSEILRAELPHIDPAHFVALSGPNLAREIAAGLPASTVAASPDENAAREVQQRLNSPLFRIYTHNDVTGVELAGALKNVYAIAAGAADALNVGENAKATLLTRALAEMTRLGAALGANPLTFAGLAGIGDLMCTCHSPHSRNHTLGERLARGEKLAEIQSGTHMVAEGVTTARAARALAAAHGIEMPLVEQVHAVLFADKSPRQAIGDLMGRGAKTEFWGIG